MIAVAFFSGHWVWSESQLDIGHDFSAVAACDNFGEGKKRTLLVTTARLMCSNFVSSCFERTQTDMSECTETLSEKQGTFGSLIEFVRGLSLKPAQKLLCRILADYTGNNATCWPSLRTLSAEIGVTRRSVRRYLSELESAGILVRQARYRPNGSRTSSRYRFNLSHTHRTEASVPDNPMQKSKTHALAGREDAVSVNEGREEIESPAKPKGKAYTIDAEQMKKPETAVKHYKTAVKQRWLDDSSRNQLSFFSCWAKVIRLHRAGKCKNPAGYFVHVLKSGLVHKFPSEQDESTAIRILKRCRTDGLIEFR